MSKSSSSACSYRPLLSTPSSPSAQSPSAEMCIELDQQIYNPGDVLSGQVLLDLERPLACDRINARLYGAARVFFTEILKTAGPNFGKTRAYEQEQVLVDKQTDLWTFDTSGSDMDEAKKRTEKSLEEIVRLSNPNAIRIGPRLLTATEKGEKLGPSSPSSHLPAGRHQFHFAFKLPSEGLHTSFDARNSAGCVRYHILVQASREGHNCLRRKLLFPVVCHKRLDDPALIGLAMESVVERGSDKKELLKVQLQLAKRGFVPGEPLDGSIKIENNSGHSVKQMSLRIVQRTTCFASRPEFSTHQSHFRTSAMGLPVAKVRSGQSLSIPIRYFVPALVPEMCVPGCIESEHLLCLDVANKRGTNVELSTPLIIGTHPTPPRRPDQGENLGEADEKIIPPLGAPPPYEEEAGRSDAILENIPPPNYAQSVAGLSAMSGGNGQGQAEGEQYTGPFCYHYNYGQATEEGEGEGKEGGR